MTESEIDKVIAKIKRCILCCFVPCDGSQFVLVV